MLNDSMYSRFSYFFKKYNLNKYYNINEPSIFFSLWGYGNLKKHKSFVVAIWRGSDIIKMEKKIKTIKKMKNVYHISISSYISRDLDRYGIKYKFIPIVGVNMKYFKPEKMGNEIYAYVPNTNSKKYYERYGMDIIQKIQKNIKYKINIVSCHQYNRKDLVGVYKRCFCGLRMTKHDGLPSQVIEMGLMGRKTFYNGNIPGSIKWDQNNIDQIVKKIEEEAKKINTINLEYSNQIRNFINVGDKWLDTRYWE